MRVLDDLPVGVLEVEVDEENGDQDPNYGQGDHGGVQPNVELHEPVGHNGAILRHLLAPPDHPVGGNVVELDASVGVGEGWRGQPREVVRLLIVERDDLVLFVLQLLDFRPSDTVTGLFTEGHRALQ